MSKAPKPALTTAFADADAPDAPPGAKFMDNPLYRKFFISFGSAFETIFRYTAHAEGLEDRKLKQLIKLEDDQLRIAFSTLTDTEIDQNKEILPGKVHAAKDAIFEPMFTVMQQLARHTPGLTTSVLHPGVYEVRVTSPRAALALVIAFLEYNEINCSDVTLGEIISTTGTPSQSYDPAVLKEVLDYIPPQFFSSPETAQASGMWMAEARKGYPFSVHYMTALIEAAETPPGKPVEYSEFIDAYRLH